MREIKFRAWDKKAKEWVAGGDAMDLNYSGRYNAFFFDNDCIDISKDVEWVQYTGLHDKNGKEIYEGDVVAYNYWGVGRWEVSWLHDSWTMCRKIGGFTDYVGAMNDSHDPYTIDWEKSEVIGNIYENPDLVK